MRRATCELVADTSKFDGPIDQAKAKLTSFGQAVSGIVSAVERTANVFNTLVDVADGIDKIKKAFDIVKDASTMAVNAMKNFPAIMEKVKSVASSAVGALRNIHPALLAIGAGGVVVAGTMYGIVKAFQGVVGISKSVAVSLRNVAVSMASISARAVSSIGTGLTNVFSGLGAIVGKVGIALGGLGISLGALDRFFKIGITSAIELGDAMKNLSARTGASIPFLFDMQKLFKNSGISADYAGNAMLNMQRALSGVNADGEPTNQMFERLGLSVENLMAMSPEDAFKTIGTTIAQLGTESEKTAASFAIFGRQGGGLKAVFKDPAFASLGGNFSQLGLSLAKNADNFSKISAKLRDSGSFFRGFFVEMAGAVAPSILELFKLFEGGNALEGFGKKIGDQIAIGVNALVGAFKSGEIFSALSLSFETAVTVLRDLLSRTFQYASNVFTAFMASSALPKIGNALTSVFSLAVKALVQMMLGGFGEAIALFQAGLQIAVEDAIGRFTAFTGTFERVIKAFLEARGGIGGITEAVAGAVMQGESGAISPDRAQAIMEERMAKGGEFFGISLTPKAFADSISGIMTETGNLFTSIKDGFGEVSPVLSVFPSQGEQASSAIKKFQEELTRLAVAGEPAKKAVEDITGTATLGAPRGRKEAEGRGMQDAVSSLQRIGGGGGAFRNDPLVRINEQQLAEQKKSNAIWQQILNASSPRDAMGAFYK
jgi:hypothetical protein